MPRALSLRRQLLTISSRQRSSTKVLRSSRTARADSTSRATSSTEFDVSVRKPKKWENRKSECSLPSTVTPRAANLRRQLLTISSRQRSVISIPGELYQHWRWKDWLFAKPSSQQHCKSEIVGEVKQGGKWERTYHESQCWRYPVQGQLGEGRPRWQWWSWRTSFWCLLKISPKTLQVRYNERMDEVPSGVCADCRVVVDKKKDWFCLKTGCVSCCGGEIYRNSGSALACTSVKAIPNWEVPQSGE